MRSTTKHTHKQHKTIWLDSRDCFFFSAIRLWENNVGWPAFTIVIFAYSCFNQFAKIYNREECKYKLSDRLERPRNDWERGKTILFYCVWKPSPPAWRWPLVHTLNNIHILYIIVWRWYLNSKTIDWEVFADPKPGLGWPPTFHNTLIFSFCRILIVRWFNTSLYFQIIHAINDRQPLTECHRNGSALCKTKRVQVLEPQFKMWRFVTKSLNHSFWPSLWNIFFFRFFFLQIR